MNSYVGLPAISSSTERNLTSSRSDSVEANLRGSPHQGVCSNPVSSSSPPELRGRNTVADFEETRCGPAIIGSINSSDTVYKMNTFFAGVLDCRATAVLILTLRINYGRRHTTIRRGLTSKTRWNGHRITETVSGVDVNSMREDCILSSTTRITLPTVAQTGLTAITGFAHPVLMSTHRGLATIPPPTRYLEYSADSPIT
jgi:hypothetical protein